MKKIVSMIMIFALCFSYVTVSAYNSEDFTIVRIPNEDGKYTYSVRYADTKEPIHLCANFDDAMYAMIPIYNADRELECYEPERAGKFTDDTGEYSSYEFSVMRWCAETGIIKGDDLGRALPYNSVSRAEASAMVMRFLGLQSKDNAENPFVDVDEDSWYRDVVATAYEIGVIKGVDDTHFNPLGNVTREEAIVMISNALEYADLLKANDEILDANDMDLISDWAKEAYKNLGHDAVKDYEDGEHRKEPILWYRPQNSALRHELAEMLYGIGRSSQLYPSQTATEYGFDKEMPVIDGSTSTYPFTEAVYANLFYNGYSHPEKPQSHSKSHTSYERLINGEVDMLFASVYPASDILELAKEKGVELELIPVAYDAMIFFTNADNPVKGLTSQQITDIYVNNAYDNWKDLGGSDAKLIPYCRNYDSGSQAQMERHFLNGNPIHEKIYEETRSEAMANILTDVMDVKYSSPDDFGLGYSIYYYYHNMDMFYGTTEQLKLLEIDGVAPNDETIADGTYPLSNNTYMVLRKDTPEDSPARKMVEFMLTERGQQCVENAGFGKLK